jgi:single-stranded DNA-specific DHH superfamily exonuclease
MDVFAQAVKRTAMDYGMFERIKDAWTWWQEWVPSPARVRIVGDDDSDGITSTYQVGNALRRAGYDVDLKIMPIHSPQDVDIAFNEPRDGYVVLDSGSGMIDYIDSFRVPTLILDHHRVQDVKVQNTFEVNPRRIGGDRVEHVSTSILGAMFAAETGNHWDVSFAGIAGAISDRQHLGGFNGLVGYVVAGAMKQGIISSSPGFALVGDTVEQSIADSLDPYFEGFTGRPDAVRGLLAKLGIQPDLPTIQLVGEPAKKLAAALTEPLEKRGVVIERMPIVYGERYALHHASKVPTLFALAQLMEAATAAKAHDVALRTLHGDPNAAKEAKAVYRKRLGNILNEIDRLRLRVHEEKNIRWAETKDGSNTGVYAHTLLTYVHGDDKPFIIFCRTGDTAKFSSRGSPSLYHAGKDLSIGLGQAAQKVGGHGGGHPGASGATIPNGKVEEFLGHLDRIIGELGTKGRA